MNGHLKTEPVIQKGAQIESKKIQPQIVGTQNAAVSVKDDRDRNSTYKCSGQEGREKLWSRAAQKGPSCQQVEERREKDQFHVFPRGFIDRRKHAGQRVGAAKIVGEVKQGTGDRYKEESRNRIIEKFSIHNHTSKVHAGAVL